VIELTEKPGDRRDFVHKRLLSAVGGFIEGGPGGAARGFLRSRSRSRTRRRTRSFRQPARTAPAQRRPRQGFRRPQQGIIPAFKRTFFGPPRAPAVAAAAPGGGCPQGFHPNKSNYFTKQGFVAEGTKCVRNRRRNLSNGRANTRSLRRMAAWDKQERKLGKTLKAIARGR